MPPDGGRLLYCHQRLLTEASQFDSEFSLLHMCTSTSRADMPHVEVDHVLCVGALDRDGEGFEGVEGEGNQASHGVIHRPS